MIFREKNKIEVHSNAKEDVQRRVGTRNNPKYLMKTVKFSDE